MILLYQNQCLSRSVIKAIHCINMISNTVNVLKLQLYSFFSQIKCNGGYQD